MMGGFAQSGTEVFSKNQKPVIRTHTSIKGTDAGTKPIITSAITKVVAPEEIGGMLGISASLESITRVIAPTIGSFVLGSVGTWAPGVVSGAVILWAIWFAYRRIVLAKAHVEPDTQPAEPCCA